MANSDAHMITLELKIGIKTTHPGLEVVLIVIATQESD